MRLAAFVMLRMRRSAPAGAVTWGGCEGCGSAVTLL